MLGLDLDSMLVEFEIATGSYFLLVTGRAVLHNKYGNIHNHEYFNDWIKFLHSLGKTKNTIASCGYFFRNIFLCYSYRLLEYLSNQNLTGRDDMLITFSVLNFRAFIIIIKK
jgi:hypothetical protein